MPITEKPSVHEYNKPVPLAIAVKVLVCPAHIVGAAEDIDGVATPLNAVTW